MRIELYIPALKGRFPKPLEDRAIKLALPTNHETIYNASMRKSCTFICTFLLVPHYCYAIIPHCDCQDTYYQMIYFDLGGEWDARDLNSDYGVKSPRSAVELAIRKLVCNYAQHHSHHCE